MLEPARVAWETKTNVKAEVALRLFIYYIPVLIFLSPTLFRAFGMMAIDGYWFIADPDRFNPDRFFAGMFVVAIVLLVIVLLE